MLPALAPGQLWLQRTRGRLLQRGMGGGGQAARLPQAGSGPRVSVDLDRVSVDLAIPRILVTLICLMCREAGQGFRLAPVTERGRWLSRRPPAIQPQASPPDACWSPLNE